MILRKMLSKNRIYFINYFLIKEDREKLPPRSLKNTWTEKILYSKKNNPGKYLKYLTKIVAKALEKKPILIIPYPSTNKFKPVNKQLPFLIVRELNKINPKWENGSGLLIRKNSIAKNTRNIASQFRSLRVIGSNRIRGKNVIIFDDVTTSGSSLKAGIKLVKKACPSSVKGMALAKKVFLRDIPLSGIL